MQYTSDLKERFVQVQKVNQIIDLTTKLRDILLANIAPVSGAIHEMHSLQKIVDSLVYSRSSDRVSTVIDCYRNSTFKTSYVINFDQIEGSSIYEKLQSLLRQSLDLGKDIGGANSIFWVCTSSSFSDPFKLMKTFYPHIYFPDEGGLYSGLYVDGDNFWHIMKSADLGEDVIRVGNGDLFVQIEVKNLDWLKD